MSGPRTTRCSDREDPDLLESFGPRGPVVFVRVPNAHFKR